MVPRIFSFQPEPLRIFFVEVSENKNWLKLETTKLFLGGCFFVKGCHAISDIIGLKLPRGTLPFLPFEWHLPSRHYTLEEVEWSEESTWQEVLVDSRASASFEHPTQLDQQVSWQQHSCSASELDPGRCSRDSKANQSHTNEAPASAQFGHRPTSKWRRWVPFLTNGLKHLQRWKYKKSDF